MSIDDVPVAFTPAGGWTEWPPPILAGCSEPRVEGAPDIDGYWRTIEVTVDGAVQPDHPGLGHVQRVEQRGDRIVVTGGGVVHLGFTARLEHLAPSATHPDAVSELRT